MGDGGKIKVRTVAGGVKEFFDEGKGEIDGLVVAHSVEGEGEETGVVGEGGGEDFREVCE